MGLTGPIGVAGLAVQVGRAVPEAGAPMGDAGVTLREGSGLTGSGVGLTGFDWVGDGMVVAATVEPGRCPALPSSLRFDATSLLGSGGSTGFCPSSSGSTMAQKASKAACAAGLPLIS